MEEADKFLRDSIGLIEREFFDFIVDRGVGDNCDVKGEGDRSRQDTRIHRG